MKPYFFVLSFSFLFFSNSNAQTVKEYSLPLHIRDSAPSSIGMVINMVAGEMEVTGAAREILEGQATFSRPEWEPLLTNRRKDDQMEIGIIMPSQGRDFSMNKPEKNFWDLKINPEIDLELLVKLGAGKADIDLSHTRLNRLNLKLGAGDFRVDLSHTDLARFKVTAGVGKLEIDLSGHRNKDLIAEMDCGLGELTLYLPENFPVLVRTSGILGEIETKGFNKQNEFYRNKAADEEGPAMKILVNGGIGVVHLETR